MVRFVDERKLQTFAERGITQKGRLARAQDVAQR